MNSCEGQRQPLLTPSLESERQEVVHFSVTTQLRLTSKWCLRGMITNQTFVNVVNGF